MFFKMHLCSVLFLCVQCMSISFLPLILASSINALLLSRLLLWPFTLSPHLLLVSIILRLMRGSISRTHSHLDWPCHALYHIGLLGKESALAFQGSARTMSPSFQGNANANFENVFYSSTLITAYTFKEDVKQIQCLMCGCFIIDCLELVCKTFPRRNDAEWFSAVPAEHYRRILLF